MYVAGLSKFTEKADLEKVFKTYGDVKEVRMVVDEKGHSKGFGFVEFETAVRCFVPPKCTCVLTTRYRTKRELHWTLTTMS